MIFDNWLETFLRRFAGHPKCEDCQGIRGGCQECQFTGYRRKT